jgi:hypothetical protein
MELIETVKESNPQIKNINVINVGDIIFFPKTSSESSKISDGRN